jgi:hypothetical protein
LSACAPPTHQQIARCPFVVESNVALGARSWYGFRIPYNIPHSLI